jgi:hypothetical protein
VNNGLERSGLDLILIGYCSDICLQRLGNTAEISSQDGRYPEQCSSRARLECEAGAVTTLPRRLIHVTYQTYALR